MNDGSREATPMVTDSRFRSRRQSYSYLLCLIDTDTGEIVQESRLCTTPEALRRRFGSEQQM
jgi:hypothetical protein